MWREIIQNSIGGIIDYTLLMHVLRHYKAPHRKVTQLLRQKKLIRVKKGLYILGEDFRQQPVSRELLANLIFGPSYISKEYALQYYGMIPEHVEVITSMTTKRKKHFATPVGEFSYAYLNLKRFAVAIKRIQIQENIFVLMATPEKAIVDMVMMYPEIRCVSEMTEHLLENIRLDEFDLQRLDMECLQKINAVYRHPTVLALLEVVNHYQKNGDGDG